MSSNQSKFNNKYTQGYYKCQNPQKYIGDLANIKFRSSWEYSFCVFLDCNERIIKWSCEQPIVTYEDLNGKIHRYYPDFYYEILVNNDANLHKRVIVEIKPKTELYPPKKPLNETAKSLENYEYAVRMHVKNKLKWNAAEDFAKKRGMEFVIITEDKLREKGILKS